MADIHPIRWLEHRGTELGTPSVDVVVADEDGLYVVDDSTASKVQREVAQGDLAVLTGGR